MVLEGTKVVELNTGLASPYAALLMSEAGAEVIKLEPPEGDPARDWGPPCDDGHRAIFAGLNRSKKSVVLDPEGANGHEVLDALLQKADVIILTEADEALWRLGYDDVSMRHPQTVYCLLTDFGREGPLAGKPGSELVLQAFSGLTASLGTIGEPPVRHGVDITSVGAGLSGFNAILATLLWRMSTGEGQYIEVSALTSALFLQSLLFASMSRPDSWSGPHCQAYTRPRDYGYTTQDGRIYFNLRRGQPEDYYELLLELGMEDALADSRFDDFGRSAVGLGRYAAELKPIGESSFDKLTTEDILRTLDDHDAQGVEVNDYEQLFHHPQFQSLDLVEETNAEGQTQTSVLRAPWRIDGVERPAPGRVPGLGEHTRDALEDAGFSEETIREMADQGVVRLMEVGSEPANGLR